MGQLNYGVHMQWNYVSEISKNMNYIYRFITFLTLFLREPDTQYALRNEEDRGHAAKDFDRVFSKFMYLLDITL